MAQIIQCVFQELSPPSIVLRTTLQQFLTLIIIQCLSRHSEWFLACKVLHWTSSYVSSEAFPEHRELFVAAYVESVFEKGNEAAMRMSVDNDNLALNRCLQKESVMLVAARLSWKNWWPILFFNFIIVASYTFLIFVIICSESTKRIPSFALSQSSTHFSRFRKNRSIFWKVLPPTILVSGSPLVAGLMGHLQKLSIPRYKMQSI